MRREIVNIGPRVEGGKAEIDRDGTVLEVNEVRVARGVLGLEVPPVEIENQMYWRNVAFVGSHL